MIIIIFLSILKLSSSKSVINFVLNYFNIKIKVKGVKNLSNHGNKKIVIMANHYTGIDYCVLEHIIKHYTSRFQHIYTIVKHNVFGDKNDRSTVSNILGFFRKDLYNFFKFLPYIRDNIKSGNDIKNKILTLLTKKNNTVLLFPEGTCTKNGIPQEFKSGSFRLCADNNIWILPMTIKYNKNIGVSRNDPININDWFNVNVLVTIHKPVYNKDWGVLKKQVFNLLTHKKKNENNTFK